VLSQLNDKESGSSINLHELSTGIYLAKLYFDNASTSTLKFIKQ
jgi:hypothetical protein